MEKLKIVWVAGFMNPEVKHFLETENGMIDNIIKSLFRVQKNNTQTEGARWVTNAIEEIKKTDKVELHVISFCSFLSKKSMEFTHDGIRYYFFRNEFESLKERLLRKLPINHQCKYFENTRYILDTIERINPDLIHVIGIERPAYALAMLQFPRKYPVIAQLQTLMVDPEFPKNYHLSESVYKFRAGIELECLKRADYIGTCATKYIEILKEMLPQKIILNTNLALKESVQIKEVKKEYDFVYFARQIEKAADHAIEAFAIVAQKYPDLKLDIVGHYSQAFKVQLDTRIKELGIEGNVIFEGELPTHDDVIDQIQKSRFAVLPLKIDLITGTIRESMACGLPVVSTITPSTPKLNKNRESILLSEKGDFQTMADNMIRLLEDEELCSRIRENAILTTNEKQGNGAVVNHWIEAYYVCIDNHRNGTAIPPSFLQ